MAFLFKRKIRKNYKYALYMAHKDLDAFINLIRTSQDGKEAMQKLMDRYGIKKRIAKRLLYHTTLRDLTNIDIEAYEKRYGITNEEE